MYDRRKEGEGSGVEMEVEVKKAKRREEMRGIDCLLVS